MPIDLDAFCALRPWLFHLTHERNVPRLMRGGAIRPAADLLEAAGRRSLLAERRADGVELSIRGEFVHIRDQSPLYAGNAALASGWTFERFVEELNRRVFFWPGTEGRPILSGLNHFGRYADDPCRVLAVPTASLFRANPSLVPELCRFNSGSPRCNGGKPSPRGPETFLPPDRFPGTCGSVTEVTYRASVTLPVAEVQVMSVRDFPLPSAKAARPRRTRAYPAPT